MEKLFNTQKIVTYLIHQKRKQQCVHKLVARQLINVS